MPRWLEGGLCFVVTEQGICTVHVAFTNKSKHICVKERIFTVVFHVHVCDVCLVLSLVYEYYFVVVENFTDGHKYN